MLVASSFAIGCGAERDRPASVADANNADSGDTIRVVTQGDGRWGPAFDAVEILRVPPDGKETSFGLVRDVAPRTDGGVLVFDAKGIEGRVLRAFDAQGRFEFDIGRAGSGPGEYASEFLRVTVQPDGTILLHESRRVVNRYAADGTFLGTFRVLHGSGRTELLPGAKGSFYTPVTLRPAVGTPRSSSVRTAGGTGSTPLTPAGATLYRYDTAGTVIDSISFTRKWLASDAPPYGFLPSQSWFPLPDGRIVVGRTDKLGFVLVDTNPDVAPLLAEVPTPPVPYHEEERAQWEATIRARNEHQDVDTEQQVPRHKLPAGVAFADADNRIWVQKHFRSQRGESRCTTVVDGACVSQTSFREQPVYVAFALDGTYLGEVRFPMGTAMIRFVGNEAWAISRNENDEQVLVKYRIRR